MKRKVTIAEERLREYIRDAVNEALNEVGDTILGQWYLGRLIKDKMNYDQDAANEIYAYAKEKVKNDPNAENVPMSKKLSAKFDNKNQSDEYRRNMFKKAVEQGYNQQKKLETPHDLYDLKYAQKGIKDTASDFHAHFSASGAKETDRQAAIDARNKRKNMMRHLNV